MKAARSLVYTALSSPAKLENQGNEVEEEDGGGEEEMLHWHATGVTSYISCYLSAAICSLPICTFLPSCARVNVKAGGGSYFLC